MKQRKVLKIGIIILIGLLIIGIVILFKMLMYPNLKFSRLKYDILIEEHRNEYTGMFEYLPETGYSTSYYYTVIDSAKREKYTLIYQDVWDIHNQKGDVDSIKIEIEKITEAELQDAINKYGKNDEKFKLKDLFEQNVEEEYRVKSIKRK